MRPPPFGAGDARAFFRGQLAFEVAWGSLLIALGASQTVTFSASLSAPSSFDGCKFQRFIVGKEKVKESSGGGFLVGMGYSRASMTPWWEGPGQADFACRVIG